MSETKENFLISDGMYNWFGLDRLGNQGIIIDTEGITRDNYPYNTSYFGCTSCYQGSVCNIPIFASYDADGDLVDYKEQPDERIGYPGKIFVPIKAGTSQYAKMPIDWHPAPCVFNITLTGLIPQIYQAHSTTTGTIYSPIYSPAHYYGPCTLQDNVSFSQLVPLANITYFGASDYSWTDFNYDIGNATFITYNNIAHVDVGLKWTYNLGQDLIHAPPQLTAIVSLSLLNGGTIYFRKVLADTFYNTTPSDLISESVENYQKRLTFDGRALSFSVNYQDIIIGESNYPFDPDIFTQYYDISNINISVIPASTYTTRYAADGKHYGAHFPNRVNDLFWFGILETQSAVCGGTNTVIRGISEFDPANAIYSYHNARITISGITNDGLDTELNDTFELHEITHQNGWSFAGIANNISGATIAGERYVALSTNPMVGDLRFEQSTNPYLANIDRPIMDCDCPENELCIKEIRVYFTLTYADGTPNTTDTDLNYEIERGNIVLTAWVEFIRDTSDSTSTASTQSVAVFKKIIATDFTKLLTNYCSDTGYNDLAYVVYNTMPTDLSFTGFELVEQLTPDDLTIQTYDFSGASIIFSADLLPNNNLTNYNSYIQWDEYETIDVIMPSFVWANKTYTVAQCQDARIGSCASWKGLYNFTETELNGLTIASNYTLTNADCFTGDYRNIRGAYKYVEPVDSNFQSVPSNFCVFLRNVTGCYSPATGISNNTIYGSNAIQYGQTPFDGIEFYYKYARLPHWNIIGDDNFYYYLQCNIIGLEPLSGYLYEEPGRYDYFVREFVFLKILDGSCPPFGTHVLSQHIASHCKYTRDYNGNVTGGPHPLWGWSATGNLVVELANPILETYNLPNCD
jgi:hypothetical protein